MCQIRIRSERGFTNRCRLSSLSNEPSYMSPNAGGRGGGGCEVSANEYSCAHGTQINFGDLTTYLTYGPGQKVPQPDRDPQHWVSRSKYKTILICLISKCAINFFLRVVTPPYLNRQIFWNRFPGPPSLRSRLGTECAPPLFRQSRTIAVCLKRINQLHFPF